MSDLFWLLMIVVGLLAWTVFLPSVGLLFLLGVLS